MQGKGLRVGGDNTQISDFFLLMLDADVSISTPQPAPGSKGKSAEMFARMSHVEGDAGNTSTTPRKRLRAQSHNTPEEDASDADVVPQGKVSDPKRLVIRIPPLRYLVHLFRNNPARTKPLWRVVEPPTSRTSPTQRFTAPSSRPRVWAGVRHSLISIRVLLLIPSAVVQRRAVRCVPCSCEKRERCRRAASRISYSHLLWGRTRLSARLVGRRCLGEPQDRFLNVSPLCVDSHFIPPPLFFFFATLAENFSHEIFPIASARPSPLLSIHRSGLSSPVPTIRPLMEGS